jgi:hypothetical protein
MSIYVVKLRMSSDSVIDSSRSIDEYTREVRYRFDVEMRRKIANVRNKYRALAYRDAVDFYGLYLVSGDKVPEIREVVKAADAEMKEISPDLYASLVEIPLDDEVIKKGKLYEQIYYAILAQMSREILDHIKKLRSEEPNKRTRKTLLKLIESFENLNIIGDERISRRVEELKGIVDMRIEEIKDTIMSDLDYVLGEIEKLF